MFLFSSSQGAVSQTPAKQASPETPVASALRGAAETTGISFDYLVKTATRESNLDPSAKARNSTATGLFQFLDQTWLQTIKTDGPKIGLQNEADQIVQGAGGQFSVPNGEARQRILALRSDPQIAAKVAGAFTAKNQSVLADNLGRNPSEGELYIAHFLGASGASDLIKLASQSPDSAAASSFPDAASSNRSIFYDRSGRAKSAAEVYSNLVFGHNTDPVQSLVAAQTTPAQAQPIAYAENDPSKGAYTARDTGKPLFGLFRGSDTGPVAKPILNAWSGLGRNAAGNGAQLSALSKGSFFPRADGAPDAEPAPIPDAVASRPAQALADVPLPPQRPQSFKLSPAQKQSGAGAPLDLLSFIRQRV